MKIDMINESHNTKTWIQTLTIILGIAIFLFGSSAFSQNLPVFDAHIHYNEKDWEDLTPDKIFEFFNNAQIRGALVSSIPEEGTIVLFEMNPQVIVPFLRPYRIEKDKSTWYKDPDIKSYMEREFEKHFYKGVGEVDFSVKYINYPLVNWMLKYLNTNQIFLQIDGDILLVEKVLNMYPGIKMILSHGGGASPVNLRRLLDSYTNLWIELAGRNKDIAPGGTIDPNWEALFISYPDRFLVGSGFDPQKTILKFLAKLIDPEQFTRIVTNPSSMWKECRWLTIIDQTNTTRLWLEQLPQNIARQIAYQNANKLFGINIR